MLAAISGLLMLGTAYALFREGFFNAFVMLVNTLLSIIVAFNFFEPMADFLEDLVRGSFLANYEDALSLAVLFAATMGLLRTITNKMQNEIVEFDGYVQQIGAGVLGLATGYLTVGFVVVMLQTLPLGRDFLGFEPRGTNEKSSRAFFPPDRMLLTMMRDLGAKSLVNRERDPDHDSIYERYATFDRAGTFDLRYTRYRRQTPEGESTPYRNELDQELDRD
jgi:hypothetical protein